MRLHVHGSFSFTFQVGGKVIEGLARFIFQQLVIALDFCHRKVCGRALFCIQRTCMPCCVPHGVQGM